MPALHPKQLEWTGGGPSGGAPSARLVAGVPPLSTRCCPSLPLSAAQDLMYQGEGALPVLRLLLLYCAVHGGIPKRHFDNLRCVCWRAWGLHGWGLGA